jgi:hypothetical protein
MGEFIDFLIVIIVIYYILKALFRIFVPVLFENAVNKAQQQQQQRQQQYRANDNQQRQYRTNNNQQQQYHTRANPGQGKIKVDYVPPKTKKKGSISDSAGDFVDYEEVK